jgi:hypothetical protein
MRSKTIKAGEVQVGDKIFNSMAFARTADWVPVSRVERRGNYMCIHTNSWTKRTHKRETIAVQREVDEGVSEF